jgi:competence protein ComEC
MPVAAVERHCVDGARWEWDGVRFSVLHPVADDYARKLPDNALSCVLKIESGHGSALIPGDIEGRAETELLQRHGDSLSANVLVAPHHGGKKTSSPDFVAAVGAREVIFPVGYRNRFGHPYPDVLARYAAAGIHRTDRDGAVSVIVGAGRTAVERERERRPRYWHNDALSPQETSP